MTDVVLHTIDNANQGQKKFANSAITRLKDIVNDPDFLYKVRNGNYSYRKYHEDDGVYIEADNNLIVEIISKGKERNTQNNNTIDLQIKIDRLKPKVVGSVTPPNPSITTNSLFFNPWMEKSDELSLAAHWMHEWLHVAGFYHKDKSPDQNDINYSIGKFVIEIGRQHALQNGISESKASTLGEGYLDSYKEHFNCME